MNLNLNLKQKIYLSLVIFGLLVFLIVILIIYPLVKEIKKNSKELVSQREKLVLLNQTRENLREMQVLYKVYQQNLDKIEEHFIDLEAPIEFIKFLEENAAKSQLLIDLTSLPPKEIKGDLWPSVTFQLTLTGSFPNFLKFLEILKNGPYLVEILNLNTKRLTEQELRAIFSQILARGKEFSLGDVKTTLSIKVYTR